jgi:hypothetical protein
MAQGHQPLSLFLKNVPHCTNEEYGTDNLRLGCKDNRHRLKTPEKFCLPNWVRHSRISFVRQVKA